MRQTASIPANLAPTEAPRIDDNALHVAWPDGHHSTYPLSYLSKYTSARTRDAFRRDPAPVHWAHAARAERAPGLRMEFAALETDEGMLAALEQLTTYGLLLIRGVPHASTGPKDLEGLAARFGELRETLYGRTFDVRTLRQSTNIAYTNLDLGLHMDLLYFENPPRFQILHYLRDRVSGGASYFVDARAAARQLNVWDIAILARVLVEFASGDLEAEVDMQKALADRITHVNYAPPFQAPLPPDTPLALFGALARFAARLALPQATLTHTLAEGEAVLFDNRRVLHARTAFEDTAVGEGETSRWLKACYIEADAVLDRRRVLLEKLGKVER